jgi:flagellar assembly factor FliW
MPTLKKVPGLLSQVRPMLRIPTKFLGDVEYTPDAVFTFPAGIPGFDSHQEYLFLNIPEIAPLMFLQSVTCRNLCFVLLPILTVAPDYQLNLSTDELRELGLPEQRRPVLGHDVLCAALISVGNKEVPYANLMAPLVVNLKTRIGLQVIHPDSGYSLRHPITLEELAVAC